MSSKLFGTDGVRGIPGQYPLTPGLLRRLGQVSAEVLLRRHIQSNGSAPVVMMGRDSRGSGPALSRYLAQGVARAGCKPVDAGMIPTPALAYLVPRRHALCGIVVSASHNPAEFNGVKFFSGDGFKMSPELEEEIEDRLAKGEGSDRSPAKAEPALPRAERQDSAALDYANFLKSSFPADLDLSRFHVVVDCANGAASRIAPALLRDLGATVFPIGCSPDGSNINRGCGALDTHAMRREVVRRGCDCGISLDGDADRVMFADHAGRLCDGDVLISMAALDLRERGLLRESAVAATVMSNYGMLLFLKNQGIRVVETPVGDRNVTEAIEREGLSLGGEASGHIVFRDFGPTGDGMLTALQILAILARSRRPLSFFRSRFKTTPQILKNVHADVRVPLEEMPELRRRIRACERRLKGMGRVFVRYSGTEPLVRILVEGPDRAELRKMSDAIADAFKKEIGFREAQPCRFN